MASAYVQLPNKFCGKENENFNIWVRKFEVATKATKDLTTKDAKLGLLPALLDGHAFQVYEQLQEDDKGDYDKLKTALAGKFSGKEHVSLYRLQFRERTRITGEPPDEYQTELIRLADIAYPTLDSVVKQDMVMDQFICGLQDSSLQEKILNADKKTLDEVVLLVRKTEAATKAVTKMSAAPQQHRSEQVAHVTADSVNSIIDKKFKELEHRILQKLEEMTVTNETLYARQNQRGDFRRSTNARTQSNRGSIPRTQFAPGFQGNCYSCGVYGHRSSQCPDRATYAQYESQTSKRQFQQQPQSTQFRQQENY